MFTRCIQRWRGVRFPSSHFCRPSSVHRPPQRSSRRSRRRRQRFWWPGFWCEAWQRFPWPGFAVWHRAGIGVASTLATMAEVATRSYRWVGTSAHIDSMRSALSPRRLTMAIGVPGNRRTCISFGLISFVLPPSVSRLTRSQAASPGLSN